MTEMFSLCFFPVIEVFGLSWKAGLSWAKKTETQVVVLEVNNHVRDGVR